jgi:sulfite exporter TauE/SafE
MLDFATIAHLAALCVSPDGWAGTLAVLREHAGVPAVLFVAGIIAGFTHCGGMCGPFVLAQVMSRTPPRAAALGQLQRLRAAALIPYHLGRLTTYSGLGVFAGGIAGTAVEMTQSRWLLAALLALASTYFILAAVRALGWMAQETRASHGPFGRIISSFWTRSVTQAGRFGSYPLGVALGFLPCGLIYGALAGAAGTGTALGGGLSMAAFALGTAPGLVTVGYAGSLLVGRFRGISQKTAIPLLALNMAIAAAFALKALA